MADHDRTHAADVLHGVYYLTSQPIPGFAQIPSESSDSPLHKLHLTSPYPRRQISLSSSPLEETYGIVGANYPALELMALYTAAAMHDFDHPGRTNAFLVATYAPQVNNCPRYQLDVAESVRSGSPEGTNLGPKR